MKNKINKIVKNDKGFSAEIVTMKLQKASRYGLPKFKKKSGQQSYTTNNQIPNDKNTIIKDTIRLENSFIFLPKIKDGIKIIIHRDISKNMIIKSVTVRKSYSDFYEASILVEYQSNVNLLPLDSITNDKVEGLDFSVPNKFIDSLGQKANSQDYYKTMEKEIALLNQQLAKNKTISEKIFTDDKANDYQGKNILKLQNKINRIHFKLKMSRKQENHILANKLLKQYDLIVLEDIDLRNMSQGFKLGKSIYDKGFGELREILAYKAVELGKYVVKVDRFFPSSQICSCCNHRNKRLHLNNRVFICEKCNLKICRDQNSAINLKNEGIRILREMLMGVYKPKKRDPNKQLLSIIRESNTPIEPANDLSLGSTFRNTKSELHGKNKPLLQAHCAK